MSFDIDRPTSRQGAAILRGTSGDCRSLVAVVNTRVSHQPHGAQEGLDLKVPDTNKRSDHISFYLARLTGLNTIRKQMESAASRLCRKKYPLQLLRQKSQEP